MELPLVDCSGIDEHAICIDVNLVGCGHHHRSFLWHNSLWWWIIIEGETAKRELDGTDSYSFTQIKGVKGWKMKDSTSYQIIALRLAGPNQSSDRTGFIPMGNDTPMTCFQRRSPSTVRVEFSLREISPLNFTSTEQGGALGSRQLIISDFQGGGIDGLNFTNFEIHWRVDFCQSNGFHLKWNWISLFSVCRKPNEARALLYY